jgi:hypothetical protein
MDPMNQPNQPQPSSPQTGYRLAGRFIEACDCWAICPCWIDEVPDDGRCTGLYVWDITTGDAGGHGLDGLRVASLSYHQGRRRASRQTVVLLIDKRASDGQREVLADVFSGRSGGPLGELAEMLGQIAAQRSATIDIAWDGVKARLDVEGGIRVSTYPKIGPSGRVTTLVDPAIAESFGSPAHIGLADEFVIDLPELDKIDVKGRNATTGWFSYTA